MSTASLRAHRETMIEPRTESKKSGLGACVLSPCTLVPPEEESRRLKKIQKRKLEHKRKNPKKGKGREDNKQCNKKIFL